MYWPVLCQLLVRLVPVVPIRILLWVLVVSDVIVIIEVELCFALDLLCNRVGPLKIRVHLQLLVVLLLHPLQEAVVSFPFQECLYCARIVLHWVLKYAGFIFVGLVKEVLMKEILLLTIINLRQWVRSRMMSACLVCALALLINGWEYR